MYMRTLSLFTILAVLSVVKGQKEEWLCNCTTKGVSDEKLTTQCCEAAPGVLVSLPPPPPQCGLVGSPLVGPAQNFVDCCTKLGGGFCCVPVNGTQSDGKSLSELLNDLNNKGYKRLLGRFAASHPLPKLRGEPRPGKDLPE
ncbi:hypothetical protein B0H14DRAFT_2575992 [Mycena olivaceomarginata]|nr:hypothetical protein B0H14DRAFT_2575992 [Mycena olivaceomarginata]